MPKENPDRFPPSESELRRTILETKIPTGESQTAHGTFSSLLTENTFSVVSPEDDVTGQKRNYAFTMGQRLHSITQEKPRLQAGDDSEVNRNFENSPQDPPQQECTRMRLNSSSSSESLSPPPYTLNLLPDCKYTGSKSGRRYLQALVPSGSLKEARPNLKAKDSTSGEFSLIYFF